MNKRNSRSMPLLPLLPAPAPSSPARSLHGDNPGLSPRDNLGLSPRNRVPSLQQFIALFKKHDDEAELLADETDDGTVLTHPLIKDVKVRVSEDPCFAAV